MTVLPRLRIPMDRSGYRVRKIRLQDEGLDSDVSSLSPEERIAHVWTLTLQTWMFMKGRFDEPRLRRDVVRIIRVSR
jgi:hypothetical protein